MYRTLRHTWGNKKATPPYPRQHTKSAYAFFKLFFNFNIHRVLFKLNNEHLYDHI